MTDKEIIKKFSDNHCLVLENNQISLREDEITAYRIVLDKSTNELLEFVKDTYLQLKAKEQECEALQMSDNEAGEIVAELKAECEELKEEIDDLKEIIQRHDNVNNALLSEFEDYLVDYYRRHKECLIDIKEYFIKECETCKEQYAITNENCADCQAQEILQKIREVLNDRQETN